MNNTKLLYEAMKRFTDTRAKAREEYLRTVKPLERAKGTQYYNDAVRKATEARQQAVEAAKFECIASVNNALGLMREVATNRAMTPPTAEQLRILQLLKMRESVTPNELQAAAVAMMGNGTALQVLDDIAKKQGHLKRGYSYMAKDGLSITEAEETICNLQKVCSAIIHGTGATKTATLSAEFNLRHNGRAYNPDDLPQDAPYASEQDFYARTISTPFDVLAQTVNN